MNNASREMSAPALRRELVTVLAYVNRGRRAQTCVDGSFGNPDAHLDRLAAAAGMQ